MKAGEEWDDRGGDVGWHHRLDAPEFEETREIVKDGEAWRAAVHRVAQSQTCLRDLTATKSVLYTVRQFSFVGSGFCVA